MKSTLYLLEFILLVLVLTSCREIINEPYPDYNPVPVVNALLIAGDTLSVNISMAEKLDIGQLGFIENAKVELFVNDQYLGTLTYENEGQYTSTTVVDPLNKYECKILVPGYDTVFCKQIIPSQPRIINVEHINIAGKDEEGHTYPAIEVTFENNLKARSYYEVVIYLLRKGWDTESFEETVLNTITDPVILNEGLPMAIFSNEIIADSVYKMHLSYFTGSYSSRDGGPMRTNLYPLKVELRQVTEDYYRFKKQYYLYMNGLDADGILTNMTNNNLYSNIKNGYGIYAAYNTTLTDTITPNLDDYYDY